VIVPVESAESSIGTINNPWDNGYFTTGHFNEINIKINNDSTDLIDYINQSITYDAEHSLTVTNTTDGIIQLDAYNEPITSNDFTINEDVVNIVPNTAASIYTAGGIAAVGNIWGKRVFNPNFNDYAEYRKTCIGVKPG